MIERSNLYLERFLLVAIVFIGLIFRLERLDQNPPSLNWDEVSHGYNAWSIATTGKDEWGEKMPAIFRAFGDYKLPIYIYATVPFVKYLGLNEYTVRSVSALAGGAAIWGVYLLTNELFKRNRIILGGYEFSLGFIAAFLLTFTPWHFFLSRPALEANLSLTLIIFGFSLLLAGRKNAFFSLLGSILLAFSLHAYNSARVFVPILFLGWLWWFGRKESLKFFKILGLLILGISGLVVCWQIYTGTGLARYQKLSLLSEAKVYEIGQIRLNSQLPTPLPKLIYNRVTYLVFTITKNHLSYFSPQFLYQIQGSQAQFAIPGVNLLGLPIMILGILGFLQIVRKGKSAEEKFLLMWLFLAPLPAALTLDPPQALRPLYLLGVWPICAALGAGTFLRTFNVKPRIQTVAFISILLVVCISFAKYWRTYWGFYRSEYSHAWQYGYQQLYEYIFANEDKYDRIIITKKLGEPHIFLAFHKPITPTQMWPNSENIRFQQSDWYWTDKVGKYYFANDWDITNTTKGYIKLESGQAIPLEKVLVVSSPGNLPNTVARIEEIRGLSGNVIFEIGERR